MIKLFQTLLLSTIILLGSYTASQASDKNVIAHDAYAFHTAPNQRNGAAFMVLKNDHDHDITLTSASSDVAERVEIHTMSMDGDIMEMRRLDQLKIPAHTDVVLEPTGKHIMLIGLHHQLEQGANIPLILSFADGHNETINISVVPPGHNLSNNHH